MKEGIILKESKLKYVFFSLLTFIQICLITVAIIFERYYYKRMGMKRHIEYTRLKYVEGIFSPANIRIFQVAIIILIIILLGVILFEKYRWHSKLFNISIILQIILSFIGLLFLTFDYFLMFKAYYYFLIAILISILIEYLKIVILYWKIKQ